MNEKPIKSQPSEENPLINHIINEKTRYIIRIILAIILLNSIVNRMIYSWNQDTHPLLFFTIESNLMLALYWILSPFIKKLRKPSIYLAVTTYMFITGFVFVFFLDNSFIEIIYNKLLQKEITDIVHYYTLTSSIITHYLMPTIVVLDFLLFTSVKFKKSLYLILVFPITYFATSMIIGAYTKVYPYPFLNAEFMGGYFNVFLAAIVFVFLFVVVIRLLVYVNGKVQQKFNDRINHVINDNPTYESKSSIKIKQVKTV